MDVWGKHRNRNTRSGADSKNKFPGIPNPTCKVKIKCTFVKALRLCTGRMAYRGSRGIALLFLDHGTRRGREVSVAPRPLFTLGKDPLPTVQEAGWDQWPVWIGAENLAPTGIRSPDRLARSQSLYRLRYPAHSESIVPIYLYPWRRRHYALPKCSVNISGDLIVHQDSCKNLKTCKMFLGFVFRDNLKHRLKPKST